MFKLNIRDYDLDKSKAILIIIDMVKGFTDFGDLSSFHIKSIAYKIRNFSNGFSSIIGINDLHSGIDVEFSNFPHHCLEGSNEVEICSELSDIKFDHVLFKNSTNGFFSEKFLDVITEYIDKNFDFIVVGCCTDICILQFCLTFKSYLNFINKNLNLIVPINLVETYESEDHPREKVQNASLYLMNNMGVILVDSDK